MHGWKHTEKYRNVIMAYSALWVLWNRIQIIEPSRPKRYTHTRTHNNIHSRSCTHIHTFCVTHDRTNEWKYRANRKEKKKREKEATKTRAREKPNRQKTKKQTDAHMKCLRSTNSREENTICVRAAERQRSETILLLCINAISSRLCTPSKYSERCVRCVCTVLSTIVEKKCVCCKNLNAIRQPVELLSLSSSSYVVNTVNQCGCALPVQCNIACCILYIIRAFV